MNRIHRMAVRKPRRRRKSSAKASSSGGSAKGGRKAAKSSSKASKPAGKATSAKGAKETKATASKRAAASAPKSGRRKPEPNMQERMEGLQGWMAEIERKQERMTRFGGVAAIVAVLAAGGALALGVINQQDAASKDDVDELTSKVNELGETLKADTETQLKALGGRIDGLEQQVKTLQQTQTQNTQDIAALRSQGGKAKAGGTGLEPALPGAKP